MKLNVLRVFIVILGATSIVAQSAHRDLKKGARHLRELVLVPPQITLTRVSLKGSEPMNTESRELEVPLILEIDAALRNLGYAVDYKTFSRPAMSSDADLRYTVDNLQKKFDTDLPILEKKSKGVRKGRFTLGDEVARLPLGDEVNALLFVRARGKVLTPNKKAFGTVVAGPSDDALVMDLALVDAKSGEVLYFAKTKSSSALGQDCEEIARTIEKAFQELPRAYAVKPSGKQPDPVAVKEAPAAANAVAAADVPTTSGPTSLRRVRVSHAVLRGMLSKAVPPKYPAIASMNLVHGDVLVRILIDKDGKVMDAKPIGGPIELYDASLKAVRQWRYRPITFNGEPLELEAEITFTFNLGK